MLQYTTNYIVLWAFMLLYMPCSAQEMGFHFMNPKKESTIIPFELVNNLMVIPVSINQSDTLRLILDTGVNSTVITNLGQYDSLSLANVRRIELSGLGGGDPIEAFQASANTIRIKDVVSNTETVYVLGQDIFFLSQVMGINVHGLIGFSLFNAFIVEIDYANKRLYLYDPEVYDARYRRWKGERLPLMIERGKPYVAGLATEYSGKKHEVKLLIDTGASHALSFYTNSDSKIKLPAKSFRSFLGKGLNGEMYGEVGRIKAFALGRLTLQQPIANFPDAEDVALALSVSDRDGSIGSELLRHFRIVFNYRQSELLIRKGPFFKSPFTYNMSGIELITPNPGVPQYVVGNVRDGSPAGLAGVKAGDELIQINGAAASRYTMNELTTLFRQKAKRKVKVLVKRNGSVLLLYEFALEDLI